MHVQPTLTDRDGIVVGFDEVFDRHFDEIFTYILRRTADVTVCEDLTAQVFFKALRGATRRRSRKVNIPAWLYRIATNEVNSWYRGKGRSPIARSLPDDDAAAEIQDREARHAEDLLAGKTELLALNTALRTLKPEDQTLIALRFLEEKSFSEIAEITGKRVGAVTMRTRRALEALRSELTRRGIDHERFGETLTRARETRYRGSDLPAKSAT